MPRKPKLLNVREHLEHINIIFECYKEYGDCPIFREELAKADLFNRSILKKHYAKRDAGDRHDIRI